VIRRSPSTTRVDFSKRGEVVGLLCLPRHGSLELLRICVGISEQGLVPDMGTPNVEVSRSRETWSCGPGGGLGGRSRLNGGE
jgi:hypothetical protein